MGITRLGIIYCIYLAIITEPVDCQEGSQRNNSFVESRNSSRKLEASSTACLCMDYWECAARNGQVYSYCGISDNEVCCFINPSLKNQLKNLNEEFTQATDQTSESGSNIDVQGLDTVKNVEMPLKRPNYEVCGHPSVPVKLDSKAHFREWPWHVAILEVTEDLYICGGALISNDKIITAAHCLSTYEGNSPLLKIRAGEYDVSNNNEPQPHVEVLIDSIHIHPGFDNASLQNDIAIIGLSRRLNYTANIQPICLPLKGGSQVSGSQCVITGWGRSSGDSSYSVVLKEVVAPLWSNDRCQRRLQKNFGSNYKLPSTALCAGDQGANGAICDGDGGGPLVCLGEDGKWQHEGIVSFGISCGSGTDIPSVYTRITSYLDWIQTLLQ